MTLLEAIAHEAGTVFSAEFAEDAVYTPAGGSARTIPVIFDRISEVTDIGELIQMDGVAATANVESAAVPEVAQDDQLAARGHDYRVVGVEPDGTGRTMLILGI